MRIDKKQKRVIKQNITKEHISIVFPQNVMLIGNI